MQATVLCTLMYGLLCDFIHSIAMYYAITNVCITLDIRIYFQISEWFDYLIFGIKNIKSYDEPGCEGTDPISNNV